MTGLSLSRMAATAAGATVATAAVATVALALGAGPSLVWTVRPAHAAPTSFDAVAAADGMRAQAYVPDAPLSSQVVDAGVPTAQTEVNELGTSTGFASDPYPGATVLSGPGLVAGETGVSPPGYPLIAQSSAPSVPSSSAEDGLLNAASTATMSSASAVAGAPTAVNGVGDLSATALSRLGADGGVTAQATDDAQDINLAGVLHIGAVKSTATLEIDPAGTPHPSTQTVVSDATIAGVAVTIDSTGIKVGGSDQALPDTSSVTGPLSSAGISVAVAGPSVTPTQVVSGALVITVSEQGDTYTYTFGRAVAAVQAASGAGSSVGPGLLTGVGPSPLTNIPSGGEGSSLSSSSSVGTGPVGPLGGGAVSTGSSPSLAAAGAISTGSGSPGPGTGSSPPAGSSGPLPGTGSGNLVAFASQAGVGLFAIVIVAALVILGGSLLIRIYAVRRPWTS